ncbi:ankyrin repeat domain-containing protein 63 [Bombina bombina]|uniref:ankyrin repeat domain-containing protein 63 n=1 Tax=Bombina bombina TaxID=8345 RepID=UPI00235B1157|nr:ankyrin repeat domain-containing protein 63 [Bombina bombina]
MLRPRDLRRSSGTRTFLDAMHGGKVHLARFVLDALDRRIINSPAGDQGRTPLMFAVCLRESELRTRFVRLLLEKGAEVNSQDEAGRTALSLACELGHLDAVKLLVQHNADPELADRAGNRPLMYAASCGHSAELHFLLRSYKRFGLRLDATNRAGVSALEAARVSGHRECERALSIKGPLSPEPQRGGTGKSQEGTGRSPKPLSRQMLERFARPFSHRREEDRTQTRSPLSRSSSCTPAHSEPSTFWRQKSLPEKEVLSRGTLLGVPGSALLRAHSWEGDTGATRGGSSQCRRLLRRVTSPDFCQGFPGGILPSYPGDLRRERRDSNCSRSLLILPSSRQPLTL